ncbi:hypothetical protein N7478_004052 [Penicillium angulare]|uniref:uncharacterized protein n=1 Tax=Penicillium angulare TaxID=116970 RepID=UPI002541A429|nr:uncharacterized protein N7478_004052 [Penicillium angulare]KAJ5278680.1 hypothetical protein N7478_004052 [Penicillium angulare]
MAHAGEVACVKAYLKSDGRSEDEIEEDKNLWHHQPSLSDDLTTRFHIINDIDKEQHEVGGSLPEDFPHEIYRLTTIDNEICTVPLKNVLYRDNFIKKVREFSDEWYS